MLFFVKIAVAPRAGAWIEAIMRLMEGALLSHLVQVRDWKSMMKLFIS